MSRMQKEIIESMIYLEAESPSQLNARFNFPETFSGFQGHFEGNPILPGICKILAVLAVLEKTHGKPLQLKEITQAKYFMPVTFGQEIAVKCGSKPNQDGSWTIKAAFQKEEAKVAMLQLVVENA